MKYYLYILKTERNTLYTGITTDVLRRFKEHQNSVHGAKYTFANKPNEIVYVDIFEDRSKASKEEYRIKHLLREKKLCLINENKEKTSQILKSL